MPHRFPTPLWPVAFLSVLLAGCGLGDVFSSSGIQGNSQPLEVETAVLQPNGRVIAVIGGRASLPDTSPRAAWPLAGHNAANTAGHVEFASDPQLAWQIDLSPAMNRGRLTSMEPLIVGDRIYALTWDQQLVALDLQTGADIWRRALPGPGLETDAFGGGLAYDAGRIFVATGSGRVLVVNAQTGDRMGEWTASGPVRTGPAFSNNHLIITDILGTMTAYTKSGQEVWQVDGPRNLVGVLGPNGPAVSRGGIFQAQPNGILLAFSQTGQEAWRYDIASQATTGRLIDTISASRALPVAHNNLILASSWANRTVAVQATTGRALWDIPVGGADTPAVTDDHVFMVTRAGVVRALQFETGYQVWSQELERVEDNPRVPGVGWFGPLMAGGNLILGSSEGQLVFLDPSSGQEVRRMNLGSPVATSMSLAAGTLLVATLDGQLHAFR